MAEITYQMVLSTLQTVGLLVGIFYYIMTLQNAQKSRDAQIFLQFSNRMGSERWQRGIRLFFDDLKFTNFNEMSSFRENKPEQWLDIRFVLGALEDFGGLVRGGYIKVDIIAITTFTPIIAVWEVLQPTIEEWRIHYPRMWSEIEYLYDQLILYKQRNLKLFE